LRQALSSAWRLWKSFGLFIGNIVGRVVLSVLYFTLFAPFAVAVRLQDPLKLKAAEAKSFWCKREPAAETLQDARRLT
jgi:hypothetical protein